MNKGDKIMIIIGIVLCVLGGFAAKALAERDNRLYKTKCEQRQVQEYTSTDEEILKELQDMNETLRDIRGLLEKVAENTRK